MTAYIFNIANKCLQIWLHFMAIGRTRLKMQCGNWSIKQRILQCLYPYKQVGLSSSWIKDWGHLNWGNLLNNGQWSSLLECVTFISSGWRERLTFFCPTMGTIWMLMTAFGRTHVMLFASFLCSSSSIELPWLSFTHLQNNIITLS